MNTASGKTLEEQIELLWDVLQDYRENSISQDDETWQSICEAMAQITQSRESINDE